MDRPLVLVADGPGEAQHARARRLCRAHRSPAYAAFLFTLISGDAGFEGSSRLDMSAVRPSPRPNQPHM